MTPHFGKYTVLCFDLLSNEMGICGGYVWRVCVVAVLYTKLFVLNLVLEWDYAYHGVFGDIVPDLMQVTHI